MKLTIDLFAAFCFIISLVSCRNTYLYEKQHFFGLGRRLIPNPKKIVLDLYGGEAHPEPLPTPVPRQNAAASRNLYQGTRQPNDTRVFRRRFEYEANEKGHQVSCDGMFDCIISFLAVESTEAIPVILRGGAGYRHFSVIVKAKPGRELKGQVRAYCRQQKKEENLPRMRSWKRFKVEDLENLRIK